jgi:hypothetical protein
LIFDKAGWEAAGANAPERGADVEAESGKGDKPATTPTGRRGSPLEVKPGTNEPGEVNGREYTGHAFDRTQGRGVPPLAVEDAIQNDTPSPGKYPGTTVHAG